MAKEDKTPTGEYSGRLAYDPDLNMHVDPDGHPVVTEDGGKTWRYANEDDPTHFERYHQKFASVDSTDNKLLQLSLEHGREKAEEIIRAEEPHHYAPHPDDPHYEEGATNADGVVTHTRLMADPDFKAAKLSSHTEANK